MHVLLSHWNRWTGGPVCLWHCTDDFLGFERSLPRDLAAVGADRYGLGVCPVCSTKLCQTNAKPQCDSNITDIERRMAMATAEGVQHIDFWADPVLTTFGEQWWAAIRKWKAAA